MRAVRSHVVHLAVAVLAIQAGALAAGVLQLSCGVGHSHDGPPAALCPMHRTSSAPEHEAHRTTPAHDCHGTTTATEHDEAAQIACGCANSVSDPYVGPPGIFPAPPSFTPGLIASAAPQAAEPPGVDLVITPHSPPPRSIAASLS